VWHAETVMLQPKDSLPHDDHLHLRTACLPDEAVLGCEGGGPYWPWLPPLPGTPPPDTDEDLAALLLTPIEVDSQNAKTFPSIKVPTSRDNERALTPLPRTEKPLP
jgi:hypothetical protein